MLLSCRGRMVAGMLDLAAPKSRIANGGAMPTYNVFRAKGADELCCAVPEARPVPAFVTTLVVEPLTIALRVVVAEAPGLNCL